MRGLWIAEEIVNRQGAWTRRAPDHDTTDHARRLVGDAKIVIHTLDGQPDFEVIPGVHKVAGVPHHRVHWDAQRVAAVLGMIRSGSVNIPQDYPTNNLARFDQNADWIEPDCRFIPAAPHADLNHVARLGGAHWKGKSQASERQRAGLQACSSGIHRRFTSACRLLFPGHTRE